MCSKKNVYASYMMSYHFNTLGSRGNTRWKCSEQAFDQASQPFF